MSRYRERDRGGGYDREDRYDRDDRDDRGGGGYRGRGGGGGGGGYDDGGRVSLLVRNLPMDCG